MTTDQVARHLTQILGRLELAASDNQPRCCNTCGCLNRRGETCPNCALTNTRPDQTRN